MKVYLEYNEVQLMEQASLCLRDRLLIRLLFHLGCRVSEALAIRISDVDFERAHVTILHLKSSVRILCPTCKGKLSRRHEFCPWCGEEVEKGQQYQQGRRRIRVLPVDKNTLDMIKSYINERFTRCDVTTPVFGINRHRAWQIVRDCARRAGLPNLVNPETGRVRGISPHRLRDAFSVHAMKLNDSGDALRLLQEHLGHASFNTTAKYRKISGEEHRKWYERLWRKQAG